MAGVSIIIAAAMTIGAFQAAAKPAALPPYRADALRNEFNQASDRVRIIALLSPTCGCCQHGQRVVQSVFTEFPSDQRLRGFVVWLPMLPADDEDAAKNQAAAFIDPRVIQLWDGTRDSGTMMSKLLQLKGTAWDVYLLYAPGVRWTGDLPPRPAFWMHQLRADTGADQKACLNPAVFRSKVSEILRRK